MERWLNVEIYAGRSLYQVFLVPSFFQGFLGYKSNKWRGLHNGLPQGSGLAPLLFSLYLSDIPSTLSNQLQYSDYIALKYQHEPFSDCEANLEVDRESLIQYFHRWRLQSNQSKTESCVFHLSTHYANRTLGIQFDATQIQHIEHPKYLGVTLDRSLIVCPLGWSDLRFLRNSKTLWS
jgi:hypothetical protein